MTTEQLLEMVHAFNVTYAGQPVWHEAQALLIDVERHLTPAPAAVTGPNPTPGLGVVSALRAITAAGLTDAGLNWLVGALASSNPNGVTDALDALRAYVGNDTALHARFYVRGTH